MIKGEEKGEGEEESSLDVVYIAAIKSRIYMDDKKHEQHFNAAR